jgi:glycosyltransferase involved in cell wall biosynthesis
LQSDAPVTVLMATYNGAAFLDEQLRSIAGQQGVGRVDLYVSDDGSTDDTLARLADWAARWDRGTFQVVRGPGQGFAENFRSLAASVPVPEGYVAFSDQDDVWHPDKLEAAIRLLGPLGVRPAVYLSRTRLVDISGAHLGESPLFARPPAFRNAIVQSIGGGNTIVLDRPGFALFAESCRRTGFVSHDWWAYMLVTGAGGTACYDPVPHIDYRQHGSNLVGANTGWPARLDRLKRLLGGGFSAWTDRNLASLAACRDLLTEESRQLVDDLAAIRSTGFPCNLLRLRRAGLYRQTAFGNLGLAAAVAIGKL